MGHWHGLMTEEEARIRPIDSHRDHNSIPSIDGYELPKACVKAASRLTGRCKSGLRDRVIQRVENKSNSISNLGGKFVGLKHKHALRPNLDIVSGLWKDSSRSRCQNRECESLGKGCAIAVREDRGDFRDTRC